jgi:hypothetical protein
VQRRSIAIVISRADNWRDARELAIAARAAGADVAVFAMDAAVPALAADVAGRAALIEADCEVIACGTSAHALGLSAAAVGVVLGSQDDHAAIVHRADRVVAFT